jgi:hypothetical protein
MHARYDRDDLIGHAERFVEFAHALPVVQRALQDHLDASVFLPRRSGRQDVPDIGHAHHVGVPALFNVWCIRPSSISSCVAVCVRSVSRDVRLPYRAKY